MFLGAPRRAAFRTGFGHAVTVRAGLFDRFEIAGDARSVDSALAHQHERRIRCLPAGCAIRDIEATLPGETGHGFALGGRRLLRFGPVLLAGRITTRNQPVDVPRVALSPP